MDKRTQLIVSIAFALTLFNSWVLFEETVIDRLGWWRYLPLPRRPVLRVGRRRDRGHHRAGVRSRPASPIGLTVYPSTRTAHPPARAATAAQRAGVSHYFCCTPSGQTMNCPPA